MKKIFNLIFPLIAILVYSCNPLDDTYNDLEKNPALNVKTLNYILKATDYKLLASTVTANKTGSFTTIADANTNIPAILNKKFILYDNGSVANITYTSTPVTIKVADSTLTNVAYTVTTVDYTASATATGTTYKDYSAAQVLLFLNWKYPTPLANQLSLLTFDYYESGVTPSSGTPTTHSFVYLNGNWVKIYTINTTQYASVNRGNYGNFTTSDNPNLPAWFNTFLKSDALVMAKAKVGDVTYVSFKSTTNFQRVLPLTYDGTNWVTTPLTVNTLTFLKKDGVWIPDPTIYYTLVTADYTYISGLTFGSAAARANLASYKNFNISTGGATSWTNDDIQQALAAFLKYKYPSAAVDQVFKVIYYQYNFGVYSYPTMAFVKSITGEFVYQP